MKATESVIQDILEGVKQYSVPLFQRTYCWGKSEWEELWADLDELINMMETEPETRHFFGSIVFLPTSNHENVKNYILIDGQQRLTTVSIILCALKNISIESGDKMFGREILNTFLVNEYKKGDNFFKLTPTQSDRDVFHGLISKDNAGDITDHPITQAYDFFEKKIKKYLKSSVDNSCSIEKLKEALIGNMLAVTIELGPRDNPFAVFEGLNAKGKELSEVDLIRNHVFMLIDRDKQEEMYNKYWFPMQEVLGDNFVEFVRHYLIKDGRNVQKREIYYSFRQNIETSNVIADLKNLSKFSEYYIRFIDPNKEPNEDIRTYLFRIKKIRMTTIYPLLLNFYNDYAEKRMSEDDFKDIILSLENYLIRRYVCRYPSNQLTKIFFRLYDKIKEEYPGDPTNGLKSALQTRSYPDDDDFRDDFITRKFSSSSSDYFPQLILEVLEDNSEKEETDFVMDLIIDYVMPTKPGTWWKDELGDNYQDVIDEYGYLIGNLTLIPENYGVGSNQSFYNKKALYKKTGLGLNKYFKDVQEWTADEILKRSEVLADKALEAWGNFGRKAKGVYTPKVVTGKKPESVTIFGETFEVNVWRDVLEQTLSTILYLDPDMFKELAEAYPYYISKNKHNLSESRKLAKGYYFNVHFSAEAIFRFCKKAIILAEWDESDWIVKLKD